MELIITYTVFSLVFTTGKDLQGPQDAGLNALTFMYGESEKEVMSITFVLFTKEDQEAMQMNDSELTDYAKTTFFGTSKPAETYTERNIMGKTSKGELLSVKIPVASDLEIHFITTDLGEKYCIGFKSVKEMPQELRTSLVNEILNSLKLAEN